MIALYIIAGILAYCLIGGVSASKHYAITSCKCGANDHWQSYWCGHSCVSVWMMGVLWPIGMPTIAGVAIGGRDKDARRRSRHNRELEEARHKKEIAKINAETLAIQEQEAGIR